MVLNIFLRGKVLKTLAVKRVSNMIFGQPECPEPVLYFETVLHERDHGDFIPLSEILCWEVYSGEI